MHLIQYPGPIASRHIDRIVADAVAAPPELAGPARTDPLALLPPPYQLFAHRALAHAAAAAARRAAGFPPAAPGAGEAAEEAASLAGYAALVPSQVCVYPSRSGSIRVDLSRYELLRVVISKPTSQSS